MLTKAVESVGSGLVRAQCLAENFGDRFHGNDGVNFGGPVGPVRNRLGAVSHRVARVLERAELGLYNAAAERGLAK